MKDHKHTLAVRYVQEVNVNSGAKWQKRWIIVHYCTGCDFSRAHGVTYEEPKERSDNEN